ncbi:MAG: restriction endonuclease subunit S [Nitrospirota bacterium]
MWGPQNGLYLPKADYKPGVGILRIDDYQDEYSRSSKELQQVSTSKANIDRYSMDKNDLIINRVNSPSHLGKCLVVESRNLPSLFESNMMRLKTATGSDVRFIALYLRSKTGKLRLIQHAKWAVNQASINQGDVGATEVPLPPVKEQQEIVKEVDRLMSLTTGIETVIDAEIIRSERFRQSILKHAFSGKLVLQKQYDQHANVTLSKNKSSKTSFNKLKNTLI